MKSALLPPLTRVEFSFPFPQDAHTAVISSIGSCFADAVVERLAAAGMETLRNPNGIVYNPVSLADSLLAEETALFEFNGAWRSWRHHGSFFAETKELLERRIAESRSAFLKHLKRSSLLILTPATAVVFELPESGLIVANCHKVPGGRFRRRLLTAEECRTALKRVTDFVADFAPECRIVFSLSPVRHNPGDLILNARSKALMLTAIHDCVDSSPNACYFPAYEILNDELRDYRFYSEDMLHPNELAYSILTRTFVSACFGEEGLAMLDEAEKRERHRRHVPGGLN